MNRRIAGYDLARALAVFGMVVVNFKIVMGAGHSGPGWLVDAVGLLEGRAAATFVVLAGVGLSLMVRRALAANDRHRLAQLRASVLRRAVFLFVVGLLYTPIWPADILHFYGLYLAAGALLLGASERRLWTVAAGLVAGFVLMILTLDYELGWDWTTLSYAGFWTSRGMVRHLVFNGFHPFFPWAAFLVVGLMLGRRDLTDRATRQRIFWIGAGAAGVAESVSRLLLREPALVARLGGAEIADALLGTHPMPPMPLYVVAGAGAACAVIAASVGVAERFREASWLRPMVATGQLALTLYVAHVVLGMGGLEAAGRLEDQSLAFSLAASSAFCVAGAAFSVLWRRRFARGPLEAAMRRVTRLPRPTAPSAEPPHDPTRAR